MANKVPELFAKTGVGVNVEEVWKTYRIVDQSYNALNGVSCRMLPGQVTIIQGPSGCGKSTLLNMLGGVDHPDRGRIQVGERTLESERSESRLAQYRLHQVGFIFQAFNLIPGLTAFENLKLPLTIARVSVSDQLPRARALLELVGMGEKLQKRPDALSGGEQQRVAVALALINDPPLILADEPTGNLDTANSVRVTDLLCSLAQKFGKTVVIATHDTVVAQRGDQILHMRDGQF
jgi:putative ABC transport system ATP-binding protein